MRDETGNVQNAEPGYQELIKRFLSWAEQEENIRAAVVIGSRARREDHPADEWSDLDLLVVAKDPRPLIESSEWLHNVGTLWITFVESTPGDEGFERRVLFEGGLDVDFAPVAAKDVRRMAGGRLPPLLADIFRRGRRFILDKDGLEELFPSVPAVIHTVSAPTESEFLNQVNDFWYHTVWTAKKARRGELWKAVSCCNMYLKNLLIQMLEWHTHAKRGPDVDTWMRGRFLEEWADPKAVAEFPKVFAYYNAEDVWRALFATMELFHVLATETAGLLNLSYPSLGEEKVRILVKTMFTGRKKPATG